VYRTETATGSEQRFAATVKNGLFGEDNFAFRRTNRTEIICRAAADAKVGSPTVPLVMIINQGARRGRQGSSTCAAACFAVSSNLLLKPRSGASKRETTAINTFDREELARHLLRDRCYLASSRWRCRAIAIEHSTPRSIE
jgi:hypothetical protein